MSKHLLVDGYLRGDLTRRTFVRRLTAAGVSLSAALAYADLLVPAAHAAPGEPYFYEGDDFYYEESHLPADVITIGVTDVGHDSAKARATVDANHQRTVVTFEVRELGAPTWTEALGATTIHSDQDREVIVLLGGLTPDTTYEARAVATNRSGRTEGLASAPFETDPAPVTPDPDPDPDPDPGPRPDADPDPEDDSDLVPVNGGGPAAQAPPAQITAALVAAPAAAKAGLAVTRISRLAVARRRQVITVVVDADHDGQVEVKAKKGAKKRPGRRRRGLVTLGEGSRKLRANVPTKVRVTLNRRGVQALTGKTEVKVLLDVVSTDRAGVQRNLRQVATLD